MFRDAKVGDRVWSIEFGWGTINSITCGPRISEMVPGSGPNEKLHVTFDIGGPTFDYRVEGDRYINSMQTLFWDQVTIARPPKPKRKVKKVVEGWLRLFEGTGGNLILADKLSDYSVSPGCCIELPGRHCKYLGEVFIHHECEVEED